MRTVFTLGNFKIKVDVPRTEYYLYEGDLCVWADDNIEVVLYKLEASYNKVG